MVRTRQANHNCYKAIVLHICHEQPAQELMILRALPYPALFPRVGRRGQGYKERQVAAFRPPRPAVPDCHTNQLSAIR